MQRLYFGSFLLVASFFSNNLLGTDDFWLGHEPDIDNRFNACVHAIRNGDQRVVAVLEEFKQQFDINYAPTVRVKRGYEKKCGNNITQVTTQKGWTQRPLLLDEAVSAGNVKAARWLLLNGANPYQTSIFTVTSNLAALFKRYLFTRVGENPLTHAKEHLDNAERNQSEKVESYKEIIKLLREAQLNNDIDSIGRSL